MIERIIISNLIYNEDYLRKVLPFLKNEYFKDMHHRIILDIIREHVQKYGKQPSIESVKVDVENVSIPESVYEQIQEFLPTITHDTSTKIEWLVDQTENFCKEKALFNAILTSVDIMDGKNKDLDKGALPKIVQDALAVSFDTAIGLDYMIDLDRRYDFYHNTEERIGFDIDYFNKITGGGIFRKSLTLFLAGPGVGKSLAMCHMASYNLTQGKNVLYITLEMAEEQIAKRIDSNLLDIPISEIEKLSKSAYQHKFDKFKSMKNPGRLIIKEYPTSSAHVQHFRFLLNELKIKKNFVPDIIYIDYLNICASARFKANQNANSYTIVKAIAEEIRGLSVEFNCAVVSATQFNRCLRPDSMIELKDGKFKQIKDILVGDKVLTTNGNFNTVKEIHVSKHESPTFKITTKSGKVIFASDRHIFPTDKGEKSILTGLRVGDILSSRKT